MSVRQLVLPVPPLNLGVSWTGNSLLNWIVKNADAEMQHHMIEMRDSVGGEQFKAVFNTKAAEINARVAARGHAVADPEAPNVPGGDA